MSTISGIKLVPWSFDSCKHPDISAPALFIFAKVLSVPIRRLHKGILKNAVDLFSGEA